LRHIDLRGNPPERLPAAIAELPRFEKLDLRRLESLVLPAGLGQLKGGGCLVYR
jgi:hypothetical protein